MRKDVISLEGFTVNGWIKILAIIKFAFAKRFYSVFILFLAIALLLYAGSRPYDLWGQFITEIKTNNTGTIFNLVEIIFILFLWIANIIKGWHDSLDKYLSVIFHCGEQFFPHLADHYALLISESDIRPLAQQIGQQKNDNKPLSLDSTNYKFKKTLSCDRGDFHPFWHYEVTVSLRSPPQKKQE